MYACYNQEGSENYQQVYGQQSYYQSEQQPYYQDYQESYQQPQVNYNQQQVNSNYNQQPTYPVYQEQQPQQYYPQQLNWQQQHSQQQGDCTYYPPFNQQAYYGNTPQNASETSAAVNHSNYPNRGRGTRSRRNARAQGPRGNYSAESRQYTSRAHMSDKTSVSTAEANVKDDEPTSVYVSNAGQESQSGARPKHELHPQTAHFFDNNNGNFSNDYRSQGRGWYDSARGRGRGRPGRYQRYENKHQNYGVVGRNNNFTKLGAKQHNKENLQSDDGKSSNQKYEEKQEPKTRLTSKQVTSSKRKPLSQRETLTEQLGNNSYECMVCCDIVRREAAIWSCNKCYHIFHLRCIKKWARSPSAAYDGENTGWRCPACQNVCQQFPSQYSCFCGQQRDPELTRYDTPHSCGEMCRQSRGDNCNHPCNILCHPGPCPPCQANVNKSCDCGAIKQSVRCGQALSVKCENKCKKTLNCGKHECDSICHPPPCDACKDIIVQECHCKKKTRDVLCGTSEAFTGTYSCGSRCGRQLECGKHRCSQPCHPGPCDLCDLQPDKVTTCPCGRSKLDDLAPGQQRSTCSDPVPTCDCVCGNILGCGPEENPHTCEKKCHSGSCGACGGTTRLKCRCGNLTKDMACKTAAQYSERRPFRCEKRCSKKKYCGRHKCSQHCCVDQEHKCNQTCNGKLTCGLHRCKETCHRGNCPTCWNVSFDVLACNCGATVLEPPIACGTKPPNCDNTCIRQHPCEHPVRHKCHSDEKCPPCADLTEKWCMGRHKLMKNLPCHLKSVTCGLPCNKDLTCGQHKCLKMCHKDECATGSEACVQPCTAVREACGHSCAAPCHAGQPCPRIACRKEIEVHCECGFRTERTLCLLGGEGSSQQYQRMAVSIAMQRPDGQGIELNNLMKKTKKIECTSECAVREKNKRLALALEIRNPDLSSKIGTPTFTPFLKDFAKQNLLLVKQVEKNFSDLVNKAQQSKQSKRSHAFPPMNRDQRRLVHDLAEFYGCETQSYDQEPVKNVVATAHKGKCWHPNVMLGTLIDRESNTATMAPTPIPHTSTKSKLAWGGAGMVSVKPVATLSQSSAPSVSPWKCTTLSGTKATPNSSEKNKVKTDEVDYFDMT